MDRPNDDSLSGESLSVEAESIVAPCVICDQTPCGIMSEVGPLCESCAGEFFGPEPTETSEPVPEPVVCLALSRPPGHSPYPCPRCGAVIGITVSYQGRREEWSCQCGNGWDMNATSEEPA
jgi:hypothetical protein